MCYSKVARQSSAPWWITSIIWSLRRRQTTPSTSNCCCRPPTRLASTCLITCSTGKSSLLARSLASLWRKRMFSEMRRKASITTLWYKLAGLTKLNNGSITLGTGQSFASMISSKSSECWKLPTKRTAKRNSSSSRGRPHSGANSRRVRREKRRKKWIHSIRYTYVQSIYIHDTRLCLRKGIILPLAQSQNHF